MSGIFFAEVVDLNNLSNLQLLGGGSTLVVIGVVVSYIIRALPVLNEERKKYRASSIDEWRGFAERQGQEIDNLHQKMRLQEENFNARLIQQELKSQECASENRKLQMEIDHLKNELARMELVYRNPSVPSIMLVAAEVTFGPDGGIRTATEGVYPLLNLVPSDLVGNDVGIILPADFRRPFFEILETLVLTPPAKEVSHIVSNCALHKNRERVKVTFIITKGLKNGNELFKLVLVPRKDWFDT